MTVGGKGPKIDMTPGMRAAGSTARFISTALRPRYYRRQFFKPWHTAVVRHFRLTAVSRASGEKRPGCARRRGRALPPQIAARVFSPRFAARKNVPSHRGRVNFQKISSSSPCVKRAGEKGWRRRRRRRPYFQNSTCKSVCAYSPFVFDTFYLSNGNSRVRAIEDSTDLETRELWNADRGSRKCDNDTTPSVILYAIDLWQKFHPIFSQGFFSSNQFDIQIKIFAHH